MNRRDNYKEVSAIWGPLNIEIDAKALEMWGEVEIDAKALEMWSETNDEALHRLIEDFMKTNKLEWYKKKRSSKRKQVSQLACSDA